MANDKRFVVKNGLQTQNINFESPDKTKNTTISLLDNGNISFNASNTQVFTVTNIGIIGVGTWNANTISSTYGGTGVNNAGRTITIGGNVNTANSFTTVGNFATTLTTTGATDVTLPTSGTLATTANLSQFVTTSGGFATTLTTTGVTNITLPTSGTLVTTANLSQFATTSANLGQFAATTSAQLRGVMSDETGTGLLVFGTNPSFTSTIDSGDSVFGAFSSPIFLTVGYTGTGTSMTNIATGVVGSGATKTINLGTAGVVGSITNINLGGAGSGNTVINSQSLIVPGNIAVGANISATTGPILTLGALATGGTGYMNGTHIQQPLTGGTGSYALATVVVAAGVVTSITQTWGGNRYTAGDILTVGSLSSVLAIAAASGNGTTATLTFSAQAAAPFEVGAQITVAGITPIEYSGTYTVTACTTTSVSYANATTAAQTIAGTVKMGAALTSSTIQVATVQGSDVYVSSAASTSIGARIRLEYDSVSVTTGYEYGAIAFGSRDGSVQASGDLALIRGVAAASSGGSDIQFWTAENATAPNLSAVITSASNLRMYNSAGTFYSELSNAPTANRIVTLPDAAGTVVLTDASGNFTANTITAALAGNANTVTGGVYTTGNQTIGGVKTFSANTTFESGNVLVGSGSIANTAYGITINNANTAVTQFRRYNSGIGEIRNYGGTFQVIAHDAYPVILSTNATERIRIDAAGNVGIGTNNPTQKLEVVGSMYLNNADTEGIIMNGGNAINRASLGIQIRTNNADAVRIDSTGRVGIGINLPTAKLHVVGTATVTDELQAKVINSTNGIMLNSRVISGSYTITANNNAMSAGPIEIASGVIVTVLDGARWVVM